MASMADNLSGQSPQRQMPCPGEHEIAALLSGLLAEPAAVAIFEHVSRCSSCEALFSRLSSRDDSFVRNLQQAAATGAHPLDPECRRMQSAAVRIPLRLDIGEQDHSQETTNATRASTISSAGPAAAPAEPGETCSALLDIPETIGRYRIRALLGSGGFGRVFLADDGQLDRQVALKVPRQAGMLRAASLDSFLHEARMAARLKHPGIVTIYDVASDPKSDCFIAMEYVEGRSLKQILAAGRLSREQAAWYVAAAAEAVHHAHKRGIVHRDLKPANLLIDLEGQLKVADFGLALPEEQQRGRMGELAGTLAYVSPEQLRGEVPHLDGRSDIWALGVILYESLTGRRPFGGSFEELRGEILEKPPRPPRQIDDTIPAELERICLRCLQKDPSDRYSTAKDLAGDLRAQLGGAVSIARPSFMRAALPTAAVILLLATPIAIVSFSFGVPKHLRMGTRLATESASVRNEEATKTIEHSADGHAWRPLLMTGTAPLQPVFPLVRRSDSWDTRPPADFVQANTAEISLLQLGETQSPRFDLRLRLSKAGAGGMAGVYVGYKPLTPTGADGWICQAIALRCIRIDELYLDRIVATVKPIDGNNFTWNPRATSIPIPATVIDELELEIRVSNFQITEIRWAGAPLVRLTERFTLSSQTPDCRGQFGLINAQGATTFHRPEFRDRWSN